MLILSLTPGPETGLGSDTRTRADAEAVGAPCQRHVIKGPMACYFMDAYI